MNTQSAFTRICILLAMGFIYSTSCGSSSDNSNEVSPTDSKIIAAQSSTSQNTLAVDTTQHRGAVTFVEGRARRLPPLAEEWIRAEMGSEILSGDKMRTLVESRAELTLRELDIIRMAPMTIVDIVRLYEETKAGNDETRIHVEKGDIWALVGEKKEKVNFDVSTPVAGAAIKGTRFSISVAEDSTTTLKVYKGEVYIANQPSGSTLSPEELPATPPRHIEGPKQIPGPQQVIFEEWYYIVKSMQKIKIGSHGELLTAESFSPDDPEEKNDWVQWNLERDKRIKEE
ncbi:MAG: FecR family protein [bacterium]